MGTRAHGLCLLVLVDIFIVALICGGFHESHNHDYMQVLILHLLDASSGSVGVDTGRFWSEPMLQMKWLWSLALSDLYVSFIMQNCQLLGLYPFLAVPNSLSAQGCLAAWSLTQSTAEGRCSYRDRP